VLFDIAVLLAYKALNGRDPRLPIRENDTTDFESMIINTKSNKGRKLLRNLHPMPEQ
jgi:hypothetical protein